MAVAVGTGSTASYNFREVRNFPEVGTQKRHAATRLGESSVQEKGYLAPLHSTTMQKFCLIFVLFLISRAQAQEMTYAEKLGFPKGAKVLILHVDDVGMSWDSNQ